MNFIVLFEIYHLGDAADVFLEGFSIFYFVVYRFFNEIIEFHIDLYL